MKGLTIKTVSRYGALLLLMSMSLLMLSCEETTGPETGGLATSYQIVASSAQLSLYTGGGMAQVMATVYTADNTTVVSGLNVSFTSVQSGKNMPVQVENGMTDSNGIARAIVFGGEDPGTLAVTASIQVSKSENISDTVFLAVTAPPDSVDNTDDETPDEIVNEVRAIELSVDNSQLRADGIQSTLVRATLKKSEIEVVHIPTTVLFETDLGQITSAVLSDSTTGVASALFTSSQIGTARIKASVGEVSQYINVFLIPGPPISVDLTFDPKTVGIQGSGRNVSLLATAHVKDDKGNAVADSTLVRFELIGFVDPVSSLSPASEGNNHISDLIPTVNGDASVAFNSGTLAGTVRIRAVVVNENGTGTGVMSETTEFQVFSGPPYLDMSDPADPFTESVITLAGGPLNIYAGELNTEQSVSTITVIEGDKYKNPVPEGTAVYFTTTGGVVTTSQGFTSEDGLATVKLYAGNPFPTIQNSRYLTNPNADYGGPSQFDIMSTLMSKGYGDFEGDGQYNDGIAIVSARSMGVDNLGRQVEVWNYVPIVFSLGVTTFTVTADRYVLSLDETANIIVRIYDRNGNPVVGGSTISFESSLGSLSHSEVVTNSPGVTTYHVALTNNLNPDTDDAGSTVVKVSLDSPNGQYTVLLDQPILLTLAP